ncbi:replicative DNA helicase [Streptomyces sp. 061-3]|uniref:replicative DNA helicase n=1 Tax=Streptomyces sp. 061-3 TaxID=2789268 RepID=UPI00397F178B
MNDDLNVPTPPRDVSAESAVLGAMMLAQEARTEVMGIVTATEFYKPAHQIVFQAIVALDAKGEPADPITVTNYLREQGDLERAGGIVSVHDHVNQVVTTANAGYHADIIHDCSVRRGLIKAGAAITQLGYSGVETGEAMNAAQAELAAAVKLRDESELTFIGEDYADFLDDVMRLEKDGQAFGVLTGFSDLDDLTHGLHPGQMIIVAGRPGLGKSTLGVDMIRSCSIQYGRPSAFFSLEMSKSEVHARITSAEAQVALHHIRGGSMTDSDWTRVAQSAGRIGAAPLAIDASPNQTVTDIKAKCRRLKQQGGLDLVVIDYLQLLTSGSSRRQENRQQEVSDMSRAIKLMAKELEVPVVVLAQLNRGPEQRADKKPVVSDLRESGSLEQDADIVILLNRPDAYESESPRAGEVDLIVDKHRNGARATITVAGQLHYSRFRDLAMS